VSHISDLREAHPSFQWTDRAEGRALIGLVEDDRPQFTPYWNQVSLREKIGLERIGSKRWLARDMDTDRHAWGETPAKAVTALLSAQEQADERRGG
jgi:hypothetical protein